MTVDTELDQLTTEGYVVLPNLVSTETCAAIKSELAPYLQGELWGRNDFEGHRSERVYALLAKSPTVVDLVMHERVLALVDSVLNPNYLLSANLAINVHPGETAQMVHNDDGYCYEPRPRAVLGVSAIWAIDDFTADNGATEIIPGSHAWGPGVERSHIWDDTVIAQDDPRMTRVEMPAGSAVVFLGTTLHRGGVHRGTTTRLGITPQYCEPWIRQIENMMMAIPPDIARTLPERLQAMLGYSIHPPFIGYVDGRNPRKLLTSEA